MEVNAPDLNYSRHNLDFGRGFYLTGLKKQAEKWADRKYALRKTELARRKKSLEEVKAIVTVYEIDFDKTELKLLSFDGYTEKWLDFVIANRGHKEATHNAEYDVIFGNIADDEVAPAIDTYMEQLRNNRVNQAVKDALLYQLTFSKPNDQYCFITDKSLESLKYLHSYEVGGVKK
jgi:hypothetical protein